MKNPKFEILNSKQIQDSNAPRLQAFENFNFKQLSLLPILCLGFRIFEERLV